MADEIPGAEGFGNPLLKHQRMLEYPNSPYGIARRALDELDGGKTSPEGYLSQLDGLAQNVRRWTQQLQAIPSQGYEEGRELIEDARESLQAVHDGLDILREYATSRSAEAAAEGLDLMAEASDFLAQLLDVTEQNMEDLEDER